MHADIVCKDILDGAVRTWALALKKNGEGP